MVALDLRGRLETSARTFGIVRSSPDQHHASAHARAVAVHLAASLAADRAEAFPHSAIAKHQAAAAWDRARQATEATRSADYSHNELMALIQTSGADGDPRCVAHLHREIAHRHREAIRRIRGRPTGSDAHRRWVARAG